MARTARLAASIAVTTLLGLTVATTGSAATVGARRAGPYALTTKTPYAPQGTIAGYQRAPHGFVPVFTENVSRHGARTLSDGDDGDALLALWTTAEQQHGLTARGRGLGPEIRRLLAANAEVGYGLLSGSGKRELRSTAVRMERRLPGVFAHAARASGTTAPRIAVLSSSVPRAIQSAASFVGGLVAADPRLAPVIGPDVPDDDLLYFHKAAVNKDYQDYVKHDPRVAAAESAVRGSLRTASTARSVLRRSFTGAFVDRIAAGAFADRFADATAAAEAVYDLWAVTKDLPDEGRWHMGRYLGARNAAWFGYLDDVTSFYENGPGFAGDDITYKMASVLLDDLFARLDAKRAGTSPLDAVLRFTHAEVIFPLAALLKLPGSQRQLPAGTEFTYANDPFRGATVSPMAANIQWDLFRKGSRYLVRMLYNEKQTAFERGCTPVARGSYFYDLDELESCYGYHPSGVDPVGQDDPMAGDDDVHVHGPVIDDQTRCVHWPSPSDVVAIRFACCRRFYPCHSCHEQTAGHAATTWPSTSRDEDAVLCGVCRSRLTIAAYLSADDACPQCGAAFNPGCRTHRHLYFA